MVLFSVCGGCDKCRFFFFLYVSDMMTYVGLTFDFTGWIGCGFQVWILSFKFFDIIR